MADVAVIFIPGIIGTELIHQGTMIWPGSVLKELIFPYRHMNEMLSTATIAGQIIREVGPKAVYKTILDYLSSALPGRIYECPYDWRRPNEISAQKLAEVVRVAAGAHSEVIIVAHSMGGLIARSYLESGQFDSSPGYRQVSSLITLATPHLGSPMAFGAALGYEKVKFLMIHF